MEKIKNLLFMFGLGITIGAIIVVILIFIVGAVPKKVTFGGVEFEILATTVSPSPTSSSLTSQSSQNNYDGWVMCWHGKFGHEFLVAYPESLIKEGINLSILLQQPWGGGAEYLPNDSLKMCLYNGVWYGEQTTPWFPYVSYIKFINDEFLVCQDSPSCSGDTWNMKRSDNPPYLQALLQQPSGSDIQVLGYK